jgi:uncharacterized membrane-anchored protein
MTSKLPQITLAFWVMKICATTLGETGGDLLSMSLNAGYAVSTCVLLGLFAVALAAQMRSSRHHVWLYWTVILCTSTAGTTLSDYMDRSLGLGYVLGSLILLTLLLSSLGLWRLATGSLSVEHVDTRRAEIFYWVTILLSNTLGTALGDFLADDSGLGFAGSALLLASAIGVVALVHFFSDVSKVAMFWVAFVLTRPLGATLGDLMTKTSVQGGLDFGTRGASLVLLTILVSAVVIQTLRLRSPRERCPA